MFAENPVDRVASLRRHGLSSERESLLVNVFCGEPCVAQGDPNCIGQPRWAAQVDVVLGEPRNQVIERRR